MVLFGAHKVKTAKYKEPKSLSVKKLVLGEATDAAPNNVVLVDREDDDADGDDDGDDEDFD